MALGIQHTYECDTEDRYTVQLNDDFILTTVTASASAVDQWLDEIYRIHRRRLHSLVVGLDIEWRPAFGRYTNPTATLQLCVGRRCLVFQLLHADAFPDSLYDFLADPDFRFVGVGISQDVQKLEEDCELHVENTSDLRTLAVDYYGMREIRQEGLMRLATRVLGVNVHKPRRIQLSNWGCRWLTYDQVQYACIDAYLSFEIGRRLIHC